MPGSPDLCRGATINRNRRYQDNGVECVPRKVGEGETGSDTPEVTTLFVVTDRAASGPGADSGAGGSTRTRPI